MRTDRTRKLGIRVSALIGAAALTLTACGSGDDSGGGDGGDGLPPKDQAITIGIANEQPYGYMDENGEATGFAPDVSRAVLKELGYSQFDFKVVEFGQLISGIKSGQFDMVAAGMYLNPERMQQVAFSDPDYCVREGIAVAKGNPKNIVDYSSFKDNPDLTMAVASGTVEVGYAEAAGVPSDQVKQYKGIDQMYDALVAGEVDGVTGTKSTVEAQVKGRSGIEAVEPFYPKADADHEDPVLPCGGYAFNLNDTAFRDAFNEQLDKFRQDGTTEEIITKYPGFSKANVEEANNHKAEDFSGN
jgi:polar amino acid transport system substrate-binding protein